MLARWRQSIREYYKPVCGEWAQGSIEGRLDASEYPTPGVVEVVRRKDPTS